MKVNIEIQSDGTYIAYNTTGKKFVLLGSGATVEEAKSDFLNSLEDAKKDYAEMKIAMPKALTENVEFVLDMSSFATFFKAQPKIALQKEKCPQMEKLENCFINLVATFSNVRFANA